MDKGAEFQTYVRSEGRHPPGAAPHEIVIDVLVKTKHPNNRGQRFEAGQLIHFA